MSKLSTRDKKVQQVIVIEGAANVVVLLIKTVVGFSTGSLAVLGDAIHSLTDVMNNIVAWLVIRVSAKPADDQHPYGHRKFETITVFGLASLLVVFAIELALHAIRHEPVAVFSENWELALMLVVLLFNIGLATWENHWAKKLDSDILKADAAHTFADVMTTAVVIVGWQLSVMGYIWVDRLCALGVSGLVLYLAFGLFKSVIPVLVDEFAVDPEALGKVVKQVDGVREIRRLRSRWIGSIKAVDLVIAVDHTLNIKQSHDIADLVELAVETEFGVQDISIHVEPY